MSIAGGAIGAGFNARSHSDVSISGGTVGHNFSALSESVVNVSGATFGSHFTAKSGSEVNISGGSFTDRFIAENGSQVTLFGGEFRLNGVAPTVSTLTLTESDVLSGTFEDGSPFIFSPLARDELNNVTLVAATLPPVDTMPLNVTGEYSPNGLRQGQTLILRDGGVLHDNFAVVNATLNVVGGSVGDALEIEGSSVTISSGTVGNGFKVYSGNEVTVAGGMIGSTFTAEAGSEVTISGGTIGSQFTAGPGSHVTISGGRIDSVRAEFNSDVTIVGTEFLLSGTPIAELTNPGETHVLDLQRLLYFDFGSSLSGTLADGSPFEFVLDDGSFPAFIGGPRDFFAPNAVLRLALVVPEPNAAVLGITVAILLVRSRPLLLLRRKRDKSGETFSRLIFERNRYAEEGERILRWRRALG